MIQTIKRKIHNFRADRQYCADANFRIDHDVISARQDDYAALINDLCAEIEAYSPAPLTDHEKIPFDDYKIVSYNGDRMGKVFCRDGEYYRGVYQESVVDFTELWRKGIIQVMGKRGYIPKTEITDFCLEEYPVILHAEKVQISTSLIWTYSMVKDAALHMIIMNSVLRRFGYKLHDGHLNNITFHNGKPLFTDLGSIVKDEGQKVSFEQELVFSACYRMVFELIGKSALARVQVYDENNNSVWIRPRAYNEQLREYRSARDALFRLLVFRANSRAKKMARNIFDHHVLKPEEVELFFSHLCTAKDDVTCDCIVDKQLPSCMDRLCQVRSVALVSCDDHDLLERLLAKGFSVSVTHYDEHIT